MVITIELFNIQIYTFFLFETNIVSFDKISCASAKKGKMNKFFPLCTRLELSFDKISCASAKRK